MTGENQGQDEQLRQWVTRRRLIQSSAALGTTALLAGCSSGSDGEPTETDATGNGDTPADNGDTPTDETTTPTEATGVEEVDQNLLYYCWLIPGDSQWNMYNPTENPISWDGLWGTIFVMDRALIHAPNTGESLQSMASDWGHEGDEAWLELKETTWHDGDQFTTEDMATGLDMWMWMSEHDENDILLDDYTIEDDLSIRFSLTQETRTSQVVSALFDAEEPYQIKAEFFSDFHERMADATPGSDEFGDVVDELTSYTDVPAIGNGPFKIEETNDTVVRMSKHEGHHNADNINFTGVEGRFFDDYTLSFLEGQVEMVTGGFPVSPDLESQLPDDFEHLHRDNAAYILLAFNHGGLETTIEDRLVYDRNVRKAIAHVIDYDQIAGNVGEKYEPTTQPGTFLPEHLVEESLLADEFDYGDFENYYTSGEDRAIQYIDASERLSYEDGEVIDDQTDEVAELTYLSTDSGYTARHGQTIRGQLDSFGFNVEFRVVDGSTMGERRQEGSFDLVSNANSVLAMDSMLNADRWELDIPRYHYKETYQIPQPIGSLDGELQSFDLLETIDAYESATTEQEAADLQLEFAWFVNQTLPQVETTQWRDYGILNTGRWETSDDRSVLQSRIAPHKMLKTGRHLIAKE